MTLARAADDNRSAFGGSSVAGDLVVSIWLWSVAALVIGMVVVGGATRLTESGLSITEWQPLLGAIPPLSHADWVAAFEKYLALVPEAGDAGLIKTYLSELQS